jgi:hypothetical protein
MCTFQSYSYAFEYRCLHVIGTGDLQREGLHLALGYRVHDVVTEKNFRTHQGKDQESLLVKQIKGKVERCTQPRCGTGTSDSRYNECSNMFMMKKKGGGLA